MNVFSHAVVLVAVHERDPKSWCSEISVLASLMIDGELQLEAAKNLEQVFARSRGLASSAHESPSLYVRGGCLIADLYLPGCFSWTGTPRNDAYILTRGA